MDMALPAVLVGIAFRPLVSGSSSLIRIYSGGFLAGFLAVLMAGVLTALALTLAGKEFSLQAKAIFVAHIPVMIIEGIICALCIRFLRDIRPEILGVKK